MNWLRELSQLRKQERVLLDDALDKMQQAEASPSLAEKKALEAKTSELLEKAQLLRQKICKIELRLIYILVGLIILGCVVGLL